jgi:hypothetical protein
MTLRPEYALGHSEFNAFLFASIGEDKAGFQLTVLSAMTRLGLDAWSEAARLANLPSEVAAQALTKTIASLPEGNWKISDAATIAARLVASLPPRGVPLASLAQGSGKLTAIKMTMPKLTFVSTPPIWLICLVIAVGWFFLVSHLTASPTFEEGPQTTTQQ